MEVTASIAESPQGKHYTYTLAYPDGRVFYVGKGTRADRIDFHLWEARNGVKSHKCNVIRKIWASGEQVVKKKEAYFASEQDAHLHEIALIFLMRPYSTLTNITDGGEGTSGRVVSEATRQQMSSAKQGKPSGNKGKHLTEEHRQNIGLANKGKPSPNKGKSPTEATRQKLSIAQKGKPAPNKGNHYSEAARQKIGEANTRRVISETTRQNMSDAQKRRRQAESTVARQLVSQSVQLTFEEIAS